MRDLKDSKATRRFLYYLVKFPFHLINKYIAYYYLALGEVMFARGFQIPIKKTNISLYRNTERHESLTIWRP